MTPRTLSFRGDAVRRHLKPCQSTMATLFVNSGGSGDLRPQAGPRRHLVEMKRPRVVTLWRRLIVSMKLLLLPLMCLARHTSSLHSDKRRNNNDMNRLWPHHLHIVAPPPPSAIISTPPLLLASHSLQLKIL